MGPYFPSFEGLDRFLRALADLYLITAVLFPAMVAIYAARRGRTMLAWITIISMFLSLISMFLSVGLFVGLIVWLSSRKYPPVRGVEQTRLIDSDPTTPGEGFTSISQDSHDAGVEQQIIEFYSLIGHQVERIIRRDERTSDFLIKARDGERRVTRCEVRDEVDDTHVKALDQAMRDEGAAQAALITTGTLSAKARRFAKGKPIRLVDWSEFESLLLRARAQAQKKPFVSQ